MLTNDSEVKSKVQETLMNCNGNSAQRELLEIVLDLTNEYSFTENQTYPRPSHPLQEKRKDSYFTLIAIILSLRTTLENELRAVFNFVNKYGTIDDVLDADEEELKDVIKCAGMPSKKAETIKKISYYIVHNLGGNIENIKKDSIEETRNELLKIPGVGEKSADCMLELGFDMPSMVVDVNVFRVASRLFGKTWAATPDFSNKHQISDIKVTLEDKLPQDYLIYQITHTMLLLHGKYVCKSKCKCSKCLISENCKYYKTLQKEDIQLKLKLPKN